MTRADALDTLTRCARESREAMSVICATNPLRPMGVEEAERTRAERAGSGEGSPSVDGQASASTVPPSPESLSSKHNAALHPSGEDPTSRVDNAGRNPARDPEAFLIDDAQPNWYDGPITLWAVVDRFGHATGFGTERFACELMERWEKRLPQFAPHRLIKLVEQRET